MQLLVVVYIFREINVAHKESKGIDSYRVPIYYTWVDRDNCGENSLSKGPDYTSRARLCSPQCSHFCLLFWWNSLELGLLTGMFGNHLAHLLLMFWGEPQHHKLLPGKDALPISPLLLLHPSLLLLLNLCLIVIFLTLVSVALSPALFVLLDEGSVNISS